MRGTPLAVVLAPPRMGPTDLAIHGGQIFTQQLDVYTTV
ncbi:hypothetical protein FRAHR75_270070 [Frankia sp. Hr75.2]|nr:hypothetical protein FRAHR75_270070 [Frankia sp. Hr75.2]SQD95582.1 hypothetical protein FMEAI12_3240024 [Parafrankia sp. Ea1.12]